MKTFRDPALAILTRFFKSDNQKLSELIESDLRSKSWDSTWHGQVQELTMGTLRLYNPIKKTLQPFLKHKPPLPQYLLLSLAVYELFEMDSIPAYATVSSWVDISKRQSPKLGGFTNAVLQSIIRQVSKEQFLGHRKSNLPEWLESFNISQFSKDQFQLWLAYMSDRPVQWSVNWEKEQGTPRLEEITDIPSFLLSDGFLSGAVQIMDQSSYLVADYGFSSEATSIIDACCGPGGKLQTWLHRNKNLTSVTAIDKNTGHLQRLRENLTRMNSLERVAIHQADLLQAEIAEPVHTVLLDAPCSGSGVMNRKPDIRFNQSVRSVRELIGLQRAMLDTTSEWVKPGGRLVYSTCSVLTEENEQQVMDFLARHEDFRIVLNKTGLRPDLVTEQGLRTAPANDSMDGACAFILERQ